MKPVILETLKPLNLKSFAYVPLPEELLIRNGWNSPLPSVGSSPIVPTLTVHVPLRGIHDRSSVMHAHDRWSDMFGGLARAIRELAVGETEAVA